MSEEKEKFEVEKANIGELVQGTPMSLQQKLNDIYVDEKLDQFLVAKSQMMAKSSMIPTWARGDQWACYSALTLAYQWGMNVNMLMPKLYKVSANAPLSMEGQLAHAIIERFAPLDEPLESEYLGDWDKILGKVEKKQSADKKSYYTAPAWNKADEQGLGIIITGSLNGKICKLKLMMSQCTTRNSTLWAENPQMQIWYRGVTAWGRRYQPGILMGIYTPEELIEEQPPRMKNITPREDQEGGSKSDQLLNKLKGQEEKTERKEVEIVENDEQQLSINEILQAEIDRSKAPIIIKDIDDYMKKVKSSSPSIEAICKKSKEIDEWVRNNVASFVKTVANWSVGA